MPRAVRGTPLRARVSRASAGLAGAAVLIGAVTVVARLAGFGRHVVFAHTVGQTCLGSVYATANLVPTIVFEALLGGALASIVVPVVSGPVARGASAEASRIVSALLTWALAVLLPVAAVGGVLAGPIIRLLLGDLAGCPRGTAVALGARMLVIFVPQLVLYGVTVILAGLLQAHRRFLGPASAPLASSLVVVSAYVLFYALAGRPARGELIGVGPAALLVLAAGTTLGVAALTVTVAVPAARTGLRVRPTFTFPPGVATRVRGLAAAGMATFVAQQAVVAVVVRLANEHGPVGAVPLYTYAWQLFHLPYAVLAVSVATSAFPTLSARAAEGDDRGYAAAAAATTRGLVLISCAAAGALAAVAGPAARVFVFGAPGATDPAVLARAVVAFAPGLVGYGLVAHLGRALYAAGRHRVSAAAVVSGWAAAAAVDVALAITVPAGSVVAAFGVGNTVGMTLGGVLLLGALVATRGRRAASGLGRALIAGVLGGLAGYAAGAAVVAALGPAGTWASVGICGAGGAAAAAAAAVVSAVIDAPDTRAVAARLAGGWGR